MATDTDLPILPFSTAQAWDEWLAEHHGRSSGLWLKIAKKGSGIDSVSFAEALEVALCYGWIDGLRKRFDAQYFIQRFTPRRPRSKWSKINRAKATELIERGLMKPAGQRQVDAARADGRWDAAYDSPSNVTVPEELQAALDANPAAREFFATLDRTNGTAILYRIHDAKRPETRARRIEKYVAMLSQHEKPYQ